jgi:hypothetical protein
MMLELHYTTFINLPNIVTIVMVKKGLALIATAIIVLLLVGNTVYSHSAEAKKSKKFTVNVYFYDWCCGKVDRLFIWLINDNDFRFTDVKSIDFVKLTANAHGEFVKAAAFSVKDKSPTHPSQTTPCVATSREPGSGLCDILTKDKKQKNTYFTRFDTDDFSN